MGSAGGEPRVLLNALKPMLGLVGEIKTPQEVMRVVGMMKDAEKLMSRCIYLNILKATCNQALKNEEKNETLHKFLATGGWGILNKWLIEFTKSENFPILLELIDVLKVLPITVDLLKQGNTGKLMKSMTKLEHSDVKKNASGLIKQWKNMIRVREAKNKPPNENEAKDEENQDQQDETVKRKLSSDPTKAADSSGFMNAIMISPPVKKKRRTSSEETNTKKTSLPLDELLKDSTIEEPEENDKVENIGSPERQPEEPSSFIYHSPAVEAANAALAQDSGDTVIIDEGSLARKKNKQKRNITWATDDKLVQVSYFELMEGEKKGSHAENFSQARHMELLFEKQAMRAVRRGEDKMVEKIEWGCLIPVDNAGVPGFIPGEKSKQKFVQAKREKSVLAYIFLSKQSLPDNPAEPDFNPDEHKRSHQATIIPHDEAQTVLPPSKVMVHPPKVTGQKLTQKHSSSQSTSRVMSTAQSSSSGSLPSQLSLAQNKSGTPMLSQNKSGTPLIVQNKSGTGNMLSPAVENIMSQLQQQMNNSPPPTIPPPNTLPHMVPPPNFAQLPPPFNIFPNPSNIPPPSIPQNVNQQHANNVMSNVNPSAQPGSLMDVSTSNFQGNRGGGTMFTGGRGFNNNNAYSGGGADRGFSATGGSGPMGSRWSGPPNQGPPPTGNQNPSWEDNNIHDSSNYNHDDNYHGGGHGQNNFGGHRGEHGGGRGFRPGGDNFRGHGVNNRGRGTGRWRGSNDRGRGNMDRGRGNMDRGRGNMDRGRGNMDRGRGNIDRGRGSYDNRGRYPDHNKDWNDNRNNHHHKKDSEWNRDGRDHGNDSGRDRNRHHSRQHDNSRGSHNRSKGSKR